MSYFKRCFFTQTPAFLSVALDYNNAILQQIYTHPFNTQLFNGKLDGARFRCYLRDDYHYLRHFATNLSHLAERAAPAHPTLSYRLNHLAKTIVAGEQGMQSLYSDYLTDIEQHTPGQAISDYIDFITNTTEKMPIPIALCSIYPCFKVYQELGARLEMTGTTYQSWVATYTDSDFIKATDDLAETINTLAYHASPMGRVEMHQLISTGISNELNFFNESYSAGIFQPDRHNFV